ncbi:hypothetical protein V6N11_047480 [Hibiscus sabdariffa]|uniref:Uncharacterized protein n=1 Tax=Hibiscus sabdariffa TaxID=183260 RepID=A0ABR2NL20_9ROSI
MKAGRNQPDLIKKEKAGRLLPDLMKNNKKKLMRAAGLQPVLMAWQSALQRRPVTGWQHGMAWQQVTGWHGSRSRAWLQIVPELQTEL